MARWMIRKVMVCLLTVFVTLGLNLPVADAIAAPMQSQSMMTMDMPAMAMKGMADSNSKGGCPYCPAMGGIPALNCGMPSPPLLADATQFEFRQVARYSSNYVIADLVLTGRNLAPETGPPRTLAHV